MREIILLSRQPEEEAVLIRLLHTLFPECKVRILLQENTTADKMKKGETAYAECTLAASDSRKPSL